MKRFTHAWLAFMAIKRLENAKMSDTNQRYASKLIDFFGDSRDDVIQGAWYPDSVIKDMASSHVLKLTPSDESENKFKRLPTTYLNYRYRKKNPLEEKSFTVDENDNLPDRCESIAHSVIDTHKMQESEDKGSPVSPTNNHIALLLFMLSHYAADAHMPFHCDSRRFSEGKNLHAIVEGEWDNMVRYCYRIDEKNERFFYDPDGYPLREPETGHEYQSSFLRKIDDELRNRKFILSWGAKNCNVWDFMSAICQYSYLLSYCFIPKEYDHTNIPMRNKKWQSLGLISFEDFSVAVLSDAVDSTARIWFRVWRRYLKWERKQRARRSGGE